MQTRQANTRRALTAQSARELALLSFRELPPELSLLGDLSIPEWRRLLRWLDINGLTLYLFDRMAKLGLREMLPPEISSRLRQNLMDNTGRALGMLEEQAAIQLGFQGSGVSYAVLKGFSLWPSSVPRPELRSQLDLDFLVAEKTAPAAREVLEARGYRLTAMSGRSWEFRANERAGVSLKEIYKNGIPRTVELHLEADDSGRGSLLARTEKRWLGGICTPVLSPADHFLGQGLHVYKHVCGESLRTSHLLEFYRHVMARHDDEAFWSQLRSLAEENPRTPIALGVATLLITRVMGDFAPEAFTSWTVDRLPPGARLWVELYGHRSVFSSFPGSKLYLLLERELEASGVPAKRSLLRSLLPRSLPPVVVRATANETMLERLRRYRAQLVFFFVRLRFHTVEGFRYMRESRRWQRRLSEFSL